MYVLEYCDERSTLNSSIFNKYISIMNMYDRGVVFFDLNESKAYYNENCRNIFKIGTSINTIQGFIEALERNFVSDCYEPGEVYIEDTDINIKYSIKPLIEGKATRYILCTVEESKKRTGCSSYISNIIGESRAILELKENVNIISRYNSTVLLLGQTGTGKELFARAIHYCSPRKDKSFIVANCGAIPDSLLESELFGYEKGAFTGANSSGKVGKFEAANGGTVFLDEIENMSSFMQNKILRVIEDRKIVRVGSNKEIELDIRIIGATNMDLNQLVEENKFRKDLYYRLNVICLRIPDLMERGDDIFLISNFLIKKYSSIFNKEIIGLSPSVQDIFKRHCWHGNIRELRNVIEYAMNFENGRYITEASLPKDFIHKENTPGIKLNDIRTMQEIEKEIIESTLNCFGWNEAGKIKAAKALGVSRSSIYRKITKYGLEHNISDAL